ncbi:hypothetical protein ACFX13_040935 [Malus domestica]
MGGRDLSGERGRGSAVQSNASPNCSSRAHIHGVTGCGNTQSSKVPQSAIPTMSMSDIHSASPTITRHLKPASSLRNELGLFLDVSRVGFTDEFISKMEPRFQAAFKDMEELNE